LDTLTHIALGASLGEVLLGKRLGRRAALAGAFANSIPDLDFVMAFFLDADDNLLAHRGFTHSILFAVIASVLCALIFERWFHRRTIHLRSWLGFFAAEIFLHIFIDAFNNYGTAWFEPFDHFRVSFQTVFVADPFFSVWLGIGLLALIICKTHQWRKRWAIVGLVCSSIYLVYCVWNKGQVDRDVKMALEEQHIPYNNIFSTPAPLNNWLWFVAAGSDSGFYVGYRSVFDKERTMDLKFFPKNQWMLKGLEDRDDVKNLMRFSQGYYTLERWGGDTLVFNDLRFGQTAGWEDSSARFAFHYYLSHPDENKLVVQRGRFASWDRKTLQAFWRRIRGR